MTKMVCRTVFLKEIYIEQHFLCEADPHVSIENTEGGRCIKRWNAWVGEQTMAITTHCLQRYGRPTQSFQIKSSFINPTRQTFTGWQAGNKGPFSQYSAWSDSTRLLNTWWWKVALSVEWRFFRLCVGLCLWENKAAEEWCSLSFAVHVHVYVDVCTRAYVGLWAWMWVSVFLRTAELSLMRESVCRLVLIKSVTT